MTTVENPSERPRIAVLVGSTRPGRLAPAVATWVTRQAERHDGFDVELVDPDDVGLPARLEVASPPAEAAFLTERLAAADGFVIVTPEYNHSYPACLKNVIDYTGSAWAGKPVAFVSYGGISGGLRAVEHLRLVLAELRAATIRETVSVHGVWDYLDDDGAFSSVKQQDVAAQSLFGELSWWARALRTARAAEPYPVP